MKKLAFKMEEMLYDDGSFSPGFVIPFQRTGLQRWLGVPKEGNVKITTQFEEYRLFWVDEALKKETEEARKTGKTFPAVVRTLDQYKVN
jgi:microcin C transport system substrate-binding protein